MYLTFINFLTFSLSLFIPTNKWRVFVFLLWCAIRVHAYVVIYSPFSLPLSLVSPSHSLFLFLPPPLSVAPSLLPFLFLPTLSSLLFSSLLFPPTHSPSPSLCSEILDGTRPPSYLVYSTGKGEYPTAGGLSGRIKGITTVFFMAVLLGTLPCRC